MIRVVLDGLVKRIDRMPVLDGLCLEAMPGEILCVAGPSGAGKTTLARLLVGLDQPDAGEIYFDGRPMTDLPPAARRVGIVFQGDSLWPHRTVAANVGFGLQVRGVSRRERRRRVSDVLSLLRIESQAARLPEALDPDLRRRAALARALVLEPEVLVLDEPSLGLEGRTRSEWRDELRRWHSEARTTTILMTSDPSEAFAMADRMAVLDLGRVLQVGPPSEVYARPSEPFVAQYLGPANVLQGRLESSDGGGGAVVRTPLGRLAGTAMAALPPEGSPVVVVVRPESLAIGGGSATGTNRFPATVERLEFLGELRRVHLRGPNDWPIAALVLNGSGGSLHHGQGLTVSVPAAHVLILPSRLAGGPPG